jgi:hypothetical protein
MAAIASLSIFSYSIGAIAQDFLLSLLRPDWVLFPAGSTSSIFLNVSLSRETFLY